jgi:hypothetical protein
MEEFGLLYGQLLRDKEEVVGVFVRFRCAPFIGTVYYSTITAPFFWVSQYLRERRRYGHPGMP